MLKKRGRIQLHEGVAAWRREQLAQGMIEVAVDGAIGVRASNLAAFHADPADRLIVATALQGHRLITADARILGWSGDVNRVSALR